MRLIKKGIQHAINRLGYKISKATSTGLDPFDLQCELIKADTPMIFDVGAHTGSVASVYRNRFPNAVLHCFEPFPDSFSALSSNTSEDETTFCHQTALSDSDGSSIFNSNSDSSTNSLLSTDTRGASYWGAGLLEKKSEIEVKTSTLDRFCDAHGISHIDILKMDTQGAEYAVLSGATEMLSAQKIHIIYTELIICPTYVGQRKLHEYLSLLDSFGYEPLDFFDQIRRRRQLVQADVIFLSSKFKDEVKDYL